MAGRPLRRARMMRNGAPSQPPSHPVEGWLVVAVRAQRPRKHAPTFRQQAGLEFYPMGQMEALAKAVRSGRDTIAWARPVMPGDRDMWDEPDSTPDLREGERMLWRVRSMLSGEEFGSEDAARAGITANAMFFDPDMSGLVFEEWIRQGKIDIG